jgi:hypothetical protein
MTKALVSDDAPRCSERASHEADSAADWRRLEQTMMKAGDRFSSLPADELQAIIDEAVTMSRQGL